MTIGALQTSTARPLPLRIRPDLVVRPLDYGGRRYWGVKDPVSLAYFQLRDEEYHVLRMLDGRTSPAEIQQRFEQTFAPSRLSLAQLHSFLAILHREGLVLADRPGQGEQLLSRRIRTRRREWGERFSNLLAIRFRGIDPEPVLRALYPWVRWAFSRWAPAACVALVLAALTLVMVQFEHLQARLPTFDAFFSAHNVVWLAVTLAVVKILHEFGHGLTCRHFGGECHEMGFMLLAFTPCLYCNVSDAWMLPNKWQRIAIGAAGMAVELVLAALCTFLWWFSQPGLFNSLCLNVMFLCSVSTVLFNGNPLLRYDGYYVLADLLEVPNLRRQSGALVRHELARWFLGVEPTHERMLPDRLQKTLLVYAVASTIYRLFVIGLILWFLHEVLEPHGLEVLVHMLAVPVIGGLLVAPAVRGAVFLRDAASGERIDKGRLLSRGGAVLAAVLLIGLVPLPYKVEVPVVLQPQDAKRVYVSVPGRLVETVRPGKTVEKGETLATLANLELERTIERLRGQRDRQRLRVRNLKRRRVTDSAAADELPAAREALADFEERLRQRLQDRDKLTLTAPIAGTVLPPYQRARQERENELETWSGLPLQERNLGCLLETGTTFCLIGDPQQVEPVLVVDQSDIELVDVGQRVEILFDQHPDTTLEGSITELAELDVQSVPRELVAAGAVPATTDAQGTARLASPSYEARVSLDSRDVPLLIGASGQAKIAVQPLSLAQRLFRYASHTFQFEL